MPSGRGILAVLAVCAAVVAFPAAASSGDANKSLSGGVMFVETPRIAKIVCVQRCASRKRLQGGSLARFTGRSFGGVVTAIFHGDPGADDDVRAKVRVLSPTRARARVPRKALSGPVSLVTSRSVSSPPSAPVTILPPLPTEVLAGSVHVFPIRGSYRFGGAAGQFGAGRGGRSHQGHDVFARCGTPLVAARGGTVQMEGYQSAAGYYLVIDADGTETDYVYMHLRRRSPFRRGDRVVTAQRIGAVGDTGNAQGCHLHFELWAGPGYYEGGRPFDPLPALRAWARADAARRAARS